MATITRTNLFHAIENTSSDFVSHEAYDRLKSWAYDAKSFTVGGWDKCPLEQVGLVKKFERRPRFEAEENIRFANEASELDAQILKYVETDLTGEVQDLVVTVVG